MTASTRLSETPLPSPRLERVERLLLWLIANLLLCAAVAWVAFQMQQEQFAPAVLFPLAVGIALGAGGCAILRLTRWPRRRAALAAALVWGLLVVVGQDYIGHRRHLRAYEDVLAQQDSLAVLASAQQREMQSGFAAYLAGRVRQHPVWWSVEIVLTAAAAVATTGIGIRIQQHNAQHPKSAPV